MDGTPEPTKQPQTHLACKPSSAHCWAQELRCIRWSLMQPNAPNALGRPRSLKRQAAKVTKTRPHANMTQVLSQFISAQARHICGKKLRAAGLYRAQRAFGPPQNPEPRAQEPPPRQKASQQAPEQPFDSYDAGPYKPQTLDPKP